MLNNHPQGTLRHSDIPRKGRAKVAWRLTDGCRYPVTTTRIEAL
jgi:hypothetical protein